MRLFVNNKILDLLMLFSEAGGCSKHFFGVRCSFGHPMEGFQSFFPNFVTHQILLCTPKLKRPCCQRQPRFHCHGSLLPVMKGYSQLFTLLKYVRNFVADPVCFSEERLFVSSDYSSIFGQKTSPSLSTQNNFKMHSFVRIHQILCECIHSL